MTDEELGREFRATCRATTRRNLLALLPGGELRAPLAAMNGTEFVDQMVIRARTELVNQQEPDGSNDVVTCACGTRLRVPSYWPCACPNCKRRIQ